MVLRVPTLAGSALALALMMGSTSASAFTLPTTPSCGIGPTNNCLVFGDFTVFSLALLNQQSVGKPIGPGEPYYVKSTPGALHDALVIGSGSNGAVLDNQDLGLPGGVDDAFDTSGNPTFVMAPGGEPAPVLAFDHSGLWDISTLGLNAFLAGDQPVIFFNLNESNNGGASLAGQDLLLWSRVSLYPTIAGPPLTFTLDGNGSAAGCPATVIGAATCQAPSAADGVALPAGENWAYVHGQICVTPSGAVESFGPCTAANSAGTKTVNQNLGADTAAFAAIFSNNALVTALLSGLYTSLSVDLRIAYTDNGFEQLFVETAAAATVDAPEPSSLALLGSGLLGMGFFWARRRRKTSAAV